MTIQKISNNSSKFPSKLKHLHQVPKSLYVVGESPDKLLQVPVVGIVGSRKVSPYGRSVTTNLARELVNKGIVIVSGLAFGVDSIAHEAAVRSMGKTVAVLPSGIKKIYPASHQGLARQIVQTKGALISEYPDDQLPMKHQFIERNRIIAALSDALLITEAAEKSGSLHTARFALEIGRPVLAVPGNITSPTSAGTNNLIKMGATPVTSAKDIYETLGIEEQIEQNYDIVGDNPSETLILKLINDGVSSGSEILARSKLKTQDYQKNLTMLEIKGRIKPLGADKWTLV